MGCVGFRGLLGLVFLWVSCCTILLPSGGRLTVHGFSSRQPAFRVETTLWAKKAKKGKKRISSPSTSGFGGAATEPCPCGAGLAYMKCCGKLHKDSQAFAKATAEQIVRARYSAYAKREIDFIIASTHPLNKNFMSDIQHWKDTIAQNCYDNFELTQCEIISENYEKEGETEIAKVQFVANMIQVDSRERTSFMETSTFERAGKHIRDGAWLYKDGLIEPVPGSKAEEKLKEEEEVEKAKEATADKAL